MYYYIYKKMVLNIFICIYFETNVTKILKAYKKMTFIYNVGTYV